VTCGGVLLPLLDNHGLEVLALLHLGLDVCDDARKVWYVLSECQCPECALWLVFVLPRAWSTLPWAEAGETWKAGTC